MLGVKVPLFSSKSVNSILFIPPSTNDISLVLPLMENLKKTLLLLFYEKKLTVHLEMLM